MKEYGSKFGVPKTADVKAYRKAKIKILRRDFKINLTDNEINHINELQSEIAIDNYCIDIINKQWNY